MRIRAPKPESVDLVRLVDGYQLCSRCGSVLVEGDTVDEVARSSEWSIYCHPEMCSPNAVRGWKAAQRAEVFREKPNTEVCRDAEPYNLAGRSRPCISILDDKHIEAELRLVTYEFSDEAPLLGCDLREILFQFGSARVGKAKISEGTRSGRGKAAEVPLHSPQKIIKIDGVWMSEFDLRMKYTTEQTRPTPMELGFDSNTNPERYVRCGSGVRLQDSWLKEKKAGNELVGHLLGWWLLCGAKLPKSEDPVFYRGVTREEGDIYARYSIVLGARDRAHGPIPDETASFVPITDSIGESISSSCPLEPSKPFLASYPQTEPHLSGP